MKKKSIFELSWLVNDAHLQETKTTKTLSYNEYLSADIFLSACHSQKELTTLPKTVSHNKTSEKQQNRKVNKKIFLAPLQISAQNLGHGRAFILSRYWQNKLYL